MASKTKPRTETPAVVIDLSYRLPDRRHGYRMGEWKRRVVRSEDALEKLLESLRERDAEYIAFDLEK